MNESKIIKSLRKQVDKIEALSKKSIENPDFTGWKEKTVRILERIGGEDSLYVKGFKKISFSLPEWVSVLDISPNEYEKAYQDGLKEAKSYLKGIIEELEEVGLPEIKSVNKKSDNMSQKSANAVVNVNVNNNLNLNIHNVLKNNLKASQYEQLQKILSIQEKDEKEGKLKKFFSDLGTDVIIKILKEIILGY